MYVVQFVPAAWAVIGGEMGLNFGLIWMYRCVMDGIMQHGRRELEVKGDRTALIYFELAS